MNHQPATALRVEEVAAYIRVSTQEQKLHGISLEAQEQKLTEYADTHGMKIVRFYKDEGVSGRKLIRKRPALQRMIQDAEKGAFRRIIFIKLDRFFRSVAEYHECMKRLSAGGVIWTATEEKYDLSTPSGEAFVNMKLTMAQFEADQVGERIRMINEYKVRSGQPLYGSQSLPFCYQVATAPDGKKCIAKRDEAIMEDLLAFFGQRHSVRAAMHAVNTQHHRSFSYAAIMGALTNELICGSYRGNPTYCDPYVTREQFDTIQRAIQRNPRTSDREHSYLFAGLIRCPCCGNRLVGSSNISHRVGKSGQPLSYQYYGYRCHKGNLDKACDFRTMAFEKRLEQAMLDAVEDILQAQKLRVLRLRASTTRPAQYDIPALQQELTRLNYAWQKGRIQRVEDYDRQYDALIQQLEAARAEQSDLRDTPDYAKIERRLSDNWKDIYRTLTPDRKRAFWRSFITTIDLDWTKTTKRIRDIQFFT